MGKRDNLPEMVYYLDITRDNAPLLAARERWERMANQLFQRRGRERRTLK